MKPIGVDPMPQYVKRQYTRMAAKNAKHPHHAPSGGQALPDRNNIIIDLVHYQLIYG
jgi:ribose 5-phosphate isomerase